MTNICVLLTGNRINDMITLQFKSRSNKDHNERQQQFFDFFT